LFTATGQELSRDSWWQRGACQHLFHPFGAGGASNISGSGEQVKTADLIAAGYTIT
jgi:hypothetical protein